MANEKYSRNLSDAARTLLIDFFEAYIATVSVDIVDERAEIAKQKAINLLRDTDIDILVFVTAINLFFELSNDLVMLAVGGFAAPREVASKIVNILETSLSQDKAYRSNLPRS